MGEVCEFDIDFEQFDDLRAVVVHDECGAHEDVWFYRFDGLKAENAKLRELVARMARALRIGGDWCDRDCLAEFGCTYSCSIADAMRELGIEVE